MSFAVKGLTCETRPVRPGTEAYLEKARQGLSNAHAKLGIRLANDAGRNAYLAVFHAAQALIFERKGKVAKSHRGVQSEFRRLERMTRISTTRSRCFSPKPTI